jgi:hypothetical protein
MSNFFLRCEAVVDDKEDGSVPKLSRAIGIYGRLRLLRHAGVEFLLFSSLFVLG